MVALPPGGGRRTSTLGTGSGRSTSVAVGRAGRGKTITNPSAFGTIFGLAVVTGVGDFELSGNSILLEIGDELLMETGDALLIEDGASTGSAAGSVTTRGVGARLVDAVGTVSGATATASGTLEEPSVADKILLEIGDDLLMETGEFLLLESGVVAPPTAIQDVDGFEITDTDDEYILEV